MKFTILIGSALFAFWCPDGSARADAPGPSAPPDSPTTLICRDREDPSVGATLVLDLARKRLVASSGVGDTILFGDRDVRVRVDAASVEWEVAHNTSTLNRAALELDVIGRVYVCQIAPRQL
jgi:hypothetical protein